MRQFKAVSQSLDRSFNLLGFSGKQLVWLGGVFSVTSFLVSGIFGASLVVGLGIGAWAGLTCAFLSGKYPHKYWSRIYPPVPYWVKGQARYTSPVAKARLGAKKLK
jgi:hypothetical protein